MMFVILFPRLIDLFKHKHYRKITDALRTNEPIRKRKKKFVELFERV